MLARYVLADLVRNPRRTLSTMVGVILGVGLFCGVLFFVDGLSASMTQRAVAPLPIDMQRIVTERVGNTVALTQSFDARRLAAGDRARVLLEVQNTGELPANEVTVRSRPGSGLRFVPGSAAVDGTSITDVPGTDIPGTDIPGTDVGENPFAHGLGKIGLNLGTVESGTGHRLTYLVEARADRALSDTTMVSSFSSRESVTPIGANEPAVVSLDDLARKVGRVGGVESATQLSIADLGSDALAAGPTTAGGPAKIFGFDDAYAGRDATIDIVSGRLATDGAVLSAEAVDALGVSIGDTVTVRLPDDSTIDLSVTGIADLSRSRSLFSSRRGGDLETFVYTRSSVIVSPERFADTVFPAFERAVAQRGARLKTPPIREIDIRLRRNLLDADPATATIETKGIASAVTRVAAHQDYLLDNISNTLSVAADDASVAKRLFVFLGLPGLLLAAMLAAYAGNVLAEAQRREQATLRIRGASRRHLRRMLVLRTALLTAAGSVMGLATGYVTAAVILGRESIERASTSSLVTSAVLGTVGGFLATGLALYITGRRSIDREINEDRAQLTSRPPLWRRARLDIIGVAVVAIGTGVALRSDAFAGTAGSVYFGRAVELNLDLLILPIAVWITGCLLAARLFGTTLARSQPRSSPMIGSVVSGFLRRSVGRRPWAIANAAIVVGLIVALATSLAAFTASYDAAKVDDARFANGADIRITPSPTARQSYTVDDAATFRTRGVAGVTPVVYGLSNVIVRSARTSDPANLAAIDPATFASVAPVSDAQFPSGDAGAALRTLTRDPTAVLVSEDMAAFLKAELGDTLKVLLARATDAQVEIELHIAGLFERFPGFPDGADAVMAIGEHTAEVPAKRPDFFLAAAGGGAGSLEQAVTSLQRGPAATDDLQIDTRATTFARDQSSLAALNIAGLVDLDSTFALAMAIVAIGIFVFGLLLQRRREYITLRAQGLEPRTIRLLITAEAGIVAIGGLIAGLLVGTAMGYYFVTVLRPLFVLEPGYAVSLGDLLAPVVLVLLATLAAAVVGTQLVNRLEPTELLRDE